MNERGPSPKLQSGVKSTLVRPDLVTGGSGDEGFSRDR
jgi:hypothetical protein